MMAVRSLCLELVAICFLASTAIPQLADGTQTPEAEAFRLRIANTLYGPIEASADRGATWHVIARVVRPAIAAASEPGVSQLPEVVRASPEGTAFGVGGGRVLRLLPDSPINRRNRSATLANVPKTFALFKDFLPPAGSPVQLQVRGREPAALAPGYTPSDGDAYLITARHSAHPAEKLSEYLVDTATVYRETAISRLRARGEKPASGILEIEGKLANGEQASAVSFLVDGVIAGFTNATPYLLRADTTRWSDGEHVLEVRALDGAGAVLTSRKMLVVVDNRPRP